MAGVRLIEIQPKGMSASKHEPDGRAECQYCGRRYTVEEYHRNASPHLGGKYCSHGCRLAAEPPRERHCVGCDLVSLDAINDGIFKDAGGELGIVFSSDGDFEYATPEHSDPIGGSVETFEASGDDESRAALVRWFEMWIQLSEKQRAIVVWALCNRDETYKDAAEKLGVTFQSIHERLKVSLKSLGPETVEAFMRIRFGNSRTRGYSRRAG